MAEHYRVHLDDGQVVEIAATPAAIRKMHPNARIQGRVVVDELGQGRVVPYQGEQPAERQRDPGYEAMTIPQLRDEIEKRGLDKPPADTKKADLIAILEANPAGDADSGGEKGQP